MAANLDPRQLSEQARVALGMDIPMGNPARDPSSASCAPQRQTTTFAELHPLLRPIPIPSSDALGIPCSSRSPNDVYGRKAGEPRRELPLVPPDGVGYRQAILRMDRP